MKNPLLLTLLALGIAGAAPAATVPEIVGHPLPPLAGFKLDGTLPALEGKVVLLDFWASWCGPCKESFPAMADLQKRFGERGLVVLAVSVDDDPRAYTRFLERMKPAFATVRDVDHKLVAVFAAPTMPTSFLVDRQGKVRFRHEGFHNAATVESYVKQIEQLLAESAP
jgi:thiol-disulfide isomerase/thioredoxin